MAILGRFSNLPIIETRRLRLRTLEMSDAEDIFEYASDPEVTKYTLWESQSRIARRSSYGSQETSRAGRLNTKPIGK
jgi:RimJ/RimL family protein N-acetyltransferase